MEGVHKATGESVALKIYDKSTLMDPLNKASLIKEIQVLEVLSHPNIVKIYDCIDGEKIVAIVLELIPGLPLNKYMAKSEHHKLDEDEAAKIFKQIVLAVEYCHSKGIAHRDLKLENILITENGEVKLIDFGFSVWVKEGKIKIFSGTRTYMSPEIITKPEYEGPPTDVWALGVILYYLLCGKFPFESSNDSELYSQIARTRYTIPEAVSLNVKNLLNAMIKVDPKKRVTARQILKYSFLL